MGTDIADFVAGQDTNAPTRVAQGMNLVQLQLRILASLLHCSS
jgi:hypothetical protein